MNHSMPLFSGQSVWVTFELSKVHLDKFKNNSIEKGKFCMFNI